MIHLPAHCPESWDNMTPVDGGRHCASCNKIIPDFSDKTEAEIIAHLQTTGQSCGRFRSDQVSDGTTYGGWQSYFKWKSAVAMLMIGSVFMISCRRHTSGMYAVYPEKHRIRKHDTTEGKRTPRARFFGEESQK